MDGCSWVPSQARGSARAVFGGDMPWHKPSNSSCGSDDRLHREREEQDVVISSQLQQQLKQIYMLLDMELEHEPHLHHAVPQQSLSSQQQLSSSSTSPFGSLAAVSSDDASSLVLTASSSTTTTTFSQQQQQQPAEASSLDTPFSPFLFSYLDTDAMIPNLEDILSMNQQEQNKDDGHADSARTSAFRKYPGHLRPKKKLKKGACGQRMIKTSMSFLAKVHSAKLAEWQRQSSSWRAAAEATTAVPPSAESLTNNIQLQHVLSERKRREKINDSFDALKSALPPSSKRDKTSILLRARDYINSLKSRVSELEEQNRIAESQLGIDYGDEEDSNGSSENSEV